MTTTTTEAAQVLGVKITREAEPELLETGVATAWLVSIAGLALMTDGLAVAGSKRVLRAATTQSEQ